MQENTEIKETHEEYQYLRLIKDILEDGNKERKNQYADGNIKRKNR